MLEYAIAGVAFFTQAVGVIVWSVRQEGKIKLQDQKIVDLKELINARFDASDTRLERIERSLNGSLRRD